MNESSDLHLIILPNSYVITILKLFIYKKAIQTTKDSKEEPDLSSGPDTISHQVCDYGQDLHLCSLASCVQKVRMDGVMAKML